MKPTTPTSPSSCPVAVPVNNASIPHKDTDTAELPTEDSKPVEESVKPLRKIQRSLSDAEYAAIFKAALKIPEESSCSDEEEEDETEEKEKPIQEAIKEEVKDPFDELIEDGKAIDELCKFAEFDEDNKKNEDEEVEQENDEDEKQDESNKENTEQEVDRHLNEITPYASDDESSNQQDNTSSGQPPSQPKKKIFKVKSKTGKFTPKKLSFPVMKLSPEQIEADYRSKVKVGKGPQSLFTSKDSKKRESRRDWMKRRSIDLIGTWVQCSDVTCHKWRYLPHAQDPSELPEYWTCGLNTDPLYDSCDKAEQEYEEDQHVFTKYTEGSIVWASMTGYPWWPAMIEVDPDYEMFAECRYNPKEISHYHVVFMDDKVTRAWVRTSQLKPFANFKESCGSMKTKGHNYKKEIQVAKQKAAYAMGLSIKERLDEFSFAKRYNGRWGRVGDRLYTDAKNKNSKTTSRRKKTHTSTPHGNSQSEDLSVDSELAEFKDLEGAIDAILDSQDGYDSFDDEIFSECDDSEFTPVSPEKPKKKKLKKSDDTEKPKKSKKEKVEKKKDEREITKSKTKDKTEKKHVPAPPGPKQKPVFAAPKALSTAQKSEAPKKSTSKENSKEVTKSTMKQPRTLVEEHLRDEKSLPKKKTFKPKSVVLKSSVVEDEDKDKEMDTEESDAFDKLDPDIFTMEMETQVNATEDGEAEGKRITEEKVKKMPKKKKVKVGESESEVSEGEPKPKKVKVESESKDDIPKPKKKKVKVDESESKVKAGEPKPKKQKVDESDTESKVKKEEPKQKKKTMQESECTVNGEEPKLKKKKVVKSESETKENEPKPKKKKSESKRDEEGSSDVEEVGDDGKKQKEKIVTGQKIMKDIDGTEDTKKVKVKKDKVEKTDKTNVTKSKSEASGTEAGSKPKKKFMAPIVKPKKPGFQAPCLTKKDNCAVDAKTKNSESKPEKRKGANAEETSQEEMGTTETKESKKTDTTESGKEARNLEDNKDISTESTTSSKEKKVNANTKESKKAMNKRTVTETENDVSTSEKISDKEQEPQTSAKNNQRMRPSKSQDPVNSDDDDMILDLEVNPEDAVTAAGKDEVDADDATGIPGSQASAASGYESDLFESEM